MSPEVNAERIGMVGRSFGGYGFAKMAFVEAHRLRASVVWGGGVHYFFQEDWLRQSTNAESYLMDHDVARCAAFGVDTIDELASVFPSMSLKSRAGPTSPPAGCCSSTARTTSKLRGPISISCWNTAVQNPLACFQADTWARLHKPCRP